MNIRRRSAPTASIDAIFKARTQVRVTGKARPTAIVMHPNDWEAVRLARENIGDGHARRLSDGTAEHGGATTLWGLPVVESEAITENTALVGDFAMGATLFDREQAVVRVGLINDQFVTEHADDPGRAAGGIRRLAAHGVRQDHR